MLSSWKDSLFVSLGWWKYSHRVLNSVPDFKAY